MSRYIDAGAIEYHEVFDGDEFVRVAYGDDIDEMPTADVQPVVKGEWIKEIAHFSDGSHCYVYHCSNCNVRRFLEKEHYCPDCGAKMERREDAEIH